METYEQIKEAKEQALEAKRTIRMAYRRLFFSDGDLQPYADIVFADILECTDILEESFEDGERPLANAYVQGRKSIASMILSNMGITGKTQYLRIAEALSDVVPEEIEGE